jgi:hypothetical protein
MFYLYIDIRLNIQSFFLLLSVLVFILADLDYDIGYGIILFLLVIFSNMFVSILLFIYKFEDNILQELVDCIIGIDR